MRSSTSSVAVEEELGIAACSDQSIYSDGTYRHIRWKNDAVCDRHRTNEPKFLPPSAAWIAAAQQAQRRLNFVVEAGLGCGDVAIVAVIVPDNWRCNSVVQSSNSFAYLDRKSVEHDLSPRCRIGQALIACREEARACRLLG
jgi:hypothetical protein